MTVSDGIIIRGIEIAQKKLREVLSGIDEVQNPKVYRNAYSMPLFFYMENSIKEAREKLLNGAEKDSYKMPDKETRKKIVKREKGAEIERIKKYIAEAEESL